MSGAQEVIVEDALVYLENVKQEFADRPGVYNQFLDIMKDFKSQAIDTPHVIRSVSQLFEGKPNLILSFNTFLPEGYKISPEDVERLGSAGAAAGGAQGQQSMGADVKPEEGQAVAQQQQQAGQTEGAGQQQGQMMAAGGEGQKELKVEDALSYLDEVKAQFEHQPHVYNQFLDIMKDFKAMVIDTPGVIERVSALFRGNDRLIYGFNTFLPPGYKIPPPGAGGYGSMSLAQVQAAGLAPQSAGGVPGALQLPGADGASANARAAQLQQQMMLQQQMLQGGDAQAQAYAQQQYMQSLAMQQAQGQSQAVATHQQPVAMEFDHAIHYVTTIKKRFAAEPETYKAFLEILHEYQKEEKSIEEVLERVSGLFHLHQDLLREFTFFLPEGVQEQAKRHLQRTHGINYLEQPARRGRSGGGGRRGAIVTTDETAWPEYRRRQRSRKRARHTNDDDFDGGDETSGSHRIQVHASDRRFFRQIKSRLASRSLWDEFLKTLALAAQGTLSCQDVVTLIADLLGHAHYDCLEQLCNQMGVPIPELPSESSASDDEDDEPWMHLPVSEMDLTALEQCTPSYRAFPPDRPKDLVTSRVPSEACLLNDDWVSVPTGSEEDFFFKNQRKNQYEEALFRCEDEQFEMDMMIDQNDSAIMRMRTLAAQIESMKVKARNPNEVYRDFRLTTNSLTVIHLSAILRLYGNEHCHEIFEMLRKNPVKTIPIVLKRLVNRAFELKRARKKLAETWNQTYRDSFHKALDYRSARVKAREAADAREAAEGLAAAQQQAAVRAESDTGGATGGGTSSQDSDQGRGAAQGVGDDREDGGSSSDAGRHTQKTTDGASKDLSVIASQESDALTMLALASPRSKPPAAPAPAAAAAIAQKLDMADGGEDETAVAADQSKRRTRPRRGGSGGTRRSTRSR